MVSVSVSNKFTGLLRDKTVNLVLKIINLKNGSKPSVFSCEICNCDENKNVRLSIKKQPSEPEIIYFFTRR